MNIMHLRQALAAATTILALALALALPAAGQAAQPVLALGFEEGSGATATDSSGQGNHGSISGATWTTGKNGGGLAFDGEDDVVAIADDASLRPATELTMSGWVYAEGYGPYGYQPVVGKSDRWQLYAIDAGTGGPSGIFETRQWSSGDAIPQQTWTHVAAVFTGTQAVLYVNGQQVEAGEWTMSSGPWAEESVDVTVGANTWWSDYFDGVLDDVRVYDEALTAPEIQADRDTPVT